VITADDERPRPSAGEGFADSVTVAFGDPGAEAYAVARLGIVPGAEPRVSALAVLCAGGRPVGVVAQGQIEVAGADRKELEAAGVRMETVAPLSAWEVSVAVEDAGFDVRLSALTPPIELDPSSPAAVAGGMQGYDQLCRVQGTVVVGGRERAIDGLGSGPTPGGSPTGTAWSRSGQSAPGSARTGPSGCKQCAAPPRPATTRTRSARGCSARRARRSCRRRA